MNCPNCGARMTALFSSLACSAECDVRPRATEPEPIYDITTPAGLKALGLRHILDHLAADKASGRP